MGKTIWLTSRSNFVKGAGFCPMYRYNRNHAGPFGYGFEPKGQSVPLSTGTYTHTGPEIILRTVMHAQETQAERFCSIPWDEQLAGWMDIVTREAIDRSAAKYEGVIKARGFLDLPEDESKAFTLALMREQQTLIEGLTWVWALYVLPNMLQRGRIVSVEAPEFVVLGCTCGLLDSGELQDHAERDCRGIGFLAKLDFVLERFQDQQLEYHEFKTSSYGRKNWQEQWERQPQLQTSMLAAERRLGKRVQSAYIHGLIKGKRDRDKETGFTGPKKQGTFLCYPFFAEANPPMVPDAEWAPLYNYFDPDGNKHTLGKRYKKQALWEIGRRGEYDARFPHKLTVGQFSEADGVPVSDPLFGQVKFQSNSEHWVKSLSPDVLSKAYQLVGPIPRDEFKIALAVDAIIAEEQLWIDRLTRVYEASIALNAGWGDPAFQQALQKIIPRAFNCDPFGSVRCDMVPLCYQHEGWQDPVGSGNFVYRRPHHAAELAQMIARGLEPPAEGLAAEDDEGEEGEW